ncbi:MAG: mechanosensitive ion channel family protein [Alphaproteobacteria bacterium]
MHQTIGHRAIFRVAMGVVFMLGWTTLNDASAQTERAPSVVRFLELLEDPDVRSFLGESAETSASMRTPMPDAEPPVRSADPVAALAARLEGWKAGARALPEEFLSIRARLRQSAENTGNGQLAGFAILCVFVGVALERLFWWASRGMRSRLAQAPRATAGDRAVLALTQFVIMLISIAMIAIGFIGGYFAFGWPDALRPVLSAMFWQILAGTFAAMIARFLVSPSDSRLRLIPMSDRCAVRAVRWSVGIVAAGAFGFLAASAFKSYGASAAVVGTITDGTVAILALLFIGFVWHWQLTRAHDSSETVRRSLSKELERWWWTAAAAMVPAAVFAGLPPLAVTIASLALVPPIVRIVRRVASAIIDGRRGTPVDIVQIPKTNLGVLVERVLRAAIIVAALVLNASVWGLSLSSIVAHDTLAARAMGAAIEVLIALLIADFVWYGVSGWIDRRMGLASGQPADGSAPTRLTTLLPLFRKVLATVLIITVGLIALSAIGVEIGPLLGAAGVVGLAVGFGAQTLVRDIVSGAFFLIEDAFRLGEYVEIGDRRGTVEAISLRSLRLRHHNGPIHTVPFGEIRSVANHSRDWAIVKLEFPFSLDTDPTKVKKVVKIVAAELAADPELSAALLEPPKSQGIRRLENYAAVIGVKFMARPGQQFVVRREVYHRLLKAFEAADLRLASRDVVVRSLEGRPSGPELAAVEVATIGKEPPR